MDNLYSLLKMAMYDNTMHKIEDVKILHILFQ